MSKADSTPRVTVLMSVYNAEAFLRAAIDSILAQTFQDFEFLIINDGSKDKSLKIIKSYNDSRIRLISRANKGLTYSLNEGLGLAHGEYIARQDADDISVPERLAKEVAYLDNHPRVGLVGSNYTHMDARGKTSITTNVFTHPDDLKVCLILCNQYGHGSVMMRRSALDQAGNYDKRVGYVEDYDLWIRLSQVSDVANFEEPLYWWRKSDSSIVHSNLELQVQQTFAVRDRAFQHFLKHRRQYKLLSWHPSGQEYRRRKATLYRDLAWLYRTAGQRWHAAVMLGLAAACQPKDKRNYRLGAKVLLKPASPIWEFEFL